MSESLRNDGRIWVPKSWKMPGIAGKPRNRPIFWCRPWLLWNAVIRHSVTWFPVTLLHVLRKNVATPVSWCEQHRFGRIPWLLKYAIDRLGEDVVRARYGNLFDMYEEITDENPYKLRWWYSPAIHYTMGGIWVDYELMTSIKGCMLSVEANFSDHGANRLGASALMQGLADGYFCIALHYPELFVRPDSGSLFLNRPSRIRGCRKGCKTIRSRDWWISRVIVCRLYSKELGHIMGLQGMDVPRNLFDYCSG